MKKPLKLSSRLLLLAALSLGLLFFFPLWRITLGAPQYPQDLEMMIWINKIVGDSEYTLQNINILNHYIGMRKIEPDSFKELIYMPWIVIGLMITGFLAALSNKRAFLTTWVVIVMIAGALGLWDFYRWEVDFGTNLDPKAPIKLEGMTYAPPFLGEKTILNIEATSYPAMGALVLGVCVLLGLAAIWVDWRSKPAKSIPKPFKYAAGSIILWASLFSLSSCSKGPSPIQYGHDMCHFCKMTVTDQRYGTELVTKKGKVFKFDSIECMGLYLKAGDIQPGDYHGLYVTDFLRPGQLIDGEQAYYLKSQQLPSPMGAYLTAFGTTEAAAQYQQDKGGETFQWQDVHQKLP